VRLARALLFPTGPRLFVASDLRLILILVLVSVVFTVLLYPATLGHVNSLFFLLLARESEFGRLPLIHFWIEYPPVYPWLTVAIHQVATLIPPFHRAGLFLAILPIVNSIFETLNLVLVYLVGARPFGASVSARAPGGDRIAWILALRSGSSRGTGEAPIPLHHSGSCGSMLVDATSCELGGDRLLIFRRSVRVSYPSRRPRAHREMTPP
jgi:hypothetical protein